MKYTYCIWDFNGTILDDVELGIYSVNKLLERCGINVIPDKSAYRKKFGFPIIDYYRELGFDFEQTSYELLAEDWVKLYLDNLSKAKLFDDVISTLEFFKKECVPQAVLSASEKAMLEFQIEGLGIRSYFDEVMGIDNIYGDSKLLIARAWRRRHPDDKVLFIGDTIHDVETAKILGAECFIVCAGHQCRERLEGCGACLFDSLTELTEYLKESR